MSVINGHNLAFPFNTYLFTIKVDKRLEGRQIFKEKKRIRIILAPVTSQQKKVRISEKENEVEIVKEGTSLVKIEYELSREEQKLLKKQFDLGNPIISKELKEWITPSFNQAKRGNLNHPLLQTKIIIPNEVSEYGRIINYRIATDIWEEIYLYK